MKKGWQTKYISAKENVRDNVSKIGACGFKGIEL